MPFDMTCISKHNIMLLATLLLRIYPNDVLYEMYDNGDCLYVVVLTLFCHSSNPSFYVNFVSYWNIVHRHVLSSDFSFNNQLYHIF